MIPAEIISSPHNARIRRLRRLRDQSAGEEWFLLEGRRVIEEALARGWEIESLYHTADQTIAGPALPTFQIAPKLLRTVSTLETAPGMLAVARKRLFPPEQISLGNCSLLLDRIQNPGNVGALLRSAAAFGANAALAARGTAHFYNSKVVRSAMGAMFHLQLCENVEAEALQPLLRAQQVELIVADSNAGEDPESLDGNARYLLALGHETTGVSSRWRALARRCIRIPTAGAVPSLNVAIAGSILLYQIARTRKEGVMAGRPALARQPAS
ncbi:MAG: RNA methyltransferase [Acidobacteria bacterium]|nr:RNA methyltransferase [Acidobacteriota bacterium]